MKQNSPYIFVLFTTTIVMLVLAGCAIRLEIPLEPNQSISSSSSSKENSSVETTKEPDLKAPTDAEVTGPNEAVTELPGAEPPMDIEQQGPDEAKPEQSGEETSDASAKKGTIESFKFNDLVLKVTNVKQIQQGDIFDGQTLWEYDIYVVYPGATVTIINADMKTTVIPSRADWAILTSDDQRIDIVDDMLPLEITESICGVFDPESGLYVLEFEMYKQ